MNTQTQGTFLLTSQQQQRNEIQRSLLNTAVQNTLTNQTTIRNDLISQLENIKNQRYAPYQPYIPPVIPASVIQLQMETANVGIPMVPMNISNCRGNQFVTTKQ